MKFLLLTLNLLIGADAVTTHYGLEHHIVKEVLIPTQNAYVIDALGASEIAFNTYAYPKLNKEHPKFTKGLLITAIIIRGAVVTNNVYQLRASR